MNPYDIIADLYDSFVNTTLDIPFFVADAEGDVLELMAGTGRVTLPLAQAGLPVTAVDNSRGLLDVLRDKLQPGDNVTVVEQDIRELDLGRQFDRIYIPFHAFPEIIGREDQLTVLRRVREHLRGHAIITLHNPVVRRQTVDGLPRLVGKFPRDGGRLVLWISQTYTPASRVVDVTETFELYDEAGRLSEKRLIELTFTLLERAAFEEMLAEANLQVTAVYGNYERTPFDPASSPFMIYLLTT